MQLSKVRIRRTIVRRTRGNTAVTCKVCLVKRVNLNEMRVRIQEAGGKGAVCRACLLVWVNESRVDRRMERNKKSQALDRVLKPKEKKEAQRTNHGCAYRSLSCALCCEGLMARTCCLALRLVLRVCVETDDQNTNVFRVWKQVCPIETWR